MIVIRRSLLSVVFSTNMFFNKSHVNVNVVLLVVLSRLSGVVRIVEQSTLVQIVKIFHKTCRLNI